MIAIDFETTRTKVAYFDEQKHEPKLIGIGRKVRTILPTIFYVPKDGEGNISVDDDAEDMAAHDPAGYVVALKKDIHKPGILFLGPKRKIDRIELASHLFRFVKEFVEENVPCFYHKTIDTCTLTVPVCFTTQQREAIRSAADKGGFRNIKIIEEPVAAAMAWLWETHQHGIDKVIICDIGGGTADFAVLRYKNDTFMPIPDIPPLEIHHGGDDLDELIILQHVEPVMKSVNRTWVERICGSLKGTFKTRVRHIKECFGKTNMEKTLHVEEVSLFIQNDTIQQCFNEFEEKIGEELKKYVMQCREKLGGQDIPILLVGGSSKLPGLKEKIKTIAGHAEVYTWQDSDYAVVLGAALDEHYKTTSAAENKQKIAEEVVFIKPETPQPAPPPQPVSPLEKRILPLSLHIEKERLHVRNDSDKQLSCAARVSSKNGELCRTWQFDIASRETKTFGREDKELQKWFFVVGEHVTITSAGYEELHWTGVDVPVPSDPAIDTYAAMPFKQLRSAASEGDHIAQFALGLRYLDGNETKQDADAARYWITESANGEFVEAQVLLGHVNQEEYPDIAVSWFHRAANNGHADAKWMLVIHGVVIKDAALVRKWGKDCADVINDPGDDGNTLFHSMVKNSGTNRFFMRSLIAERM